MRLFTKIFLCGVFVFGLAFSMTGYFLLHYSMENSMAREADFALKQFQYDKFTVQSAFLVHRDYDMAMVVMDAYPSDGEGWFMIWQPLPEGTSGSGAADGTQGKAPEESGSIRVGGEPGEALEEMFAFLAGEISVPAAFFREDGRVLYSEIEGLEASFLELLKGDAHVYRFWEGPRGSSILVGSALECSWLDMRILFVTQWDISGILEQQDTLQQYFLRSYIIAMGAGMVLLGILSFFLTSPLKRMAKAACRITRGDYGERLRIRGKDEIGELAFHFNQMADAVEEKVEALSHAAREREDFVANFAHELKTPLTSIIGYADMIYQKELPREAVRDASWYIWNEGMRLEALSLKLMDLTILGRCDFSLQEMRADEFLRDVAEGLRPLLEGAGIALAAEAEEAYIMGDYDLLKTLMINLMDNSRKAGCSRISLSGKAEGGEYRIRVSDDGCGMEEEELSRITEAFYMVDKARSRKLHGAGLGLALAERIAGIHGCTLAFESRKDEGTKVSFCLKCGAETEGG